MKRIPGVLAAGILMLGVISVGSGNQQKPEAQLIKTVISGVPHSALFGLSFAQGRGLAVGTGGRIFESADAGTTWTPLEQSPTSLAFLAVSQRGNDAVAVGQAGLVAVSAAAGKWQLGKSGTDARLLVVDLNSSGLAVAAGEFGTVIKSRDGGRTWSSTAPDWSLMASKDHFGTGEPTIYAVTVSDSGQITLAGEFGVMVRSVDGGATWRVLRPVDPSAATVHALFLQPAGEGNSYAVGQKGELLISPDGGEIWGRCTTGTDLNFLGVSASPNGEVVISGMRVMYRSTTRGMTWESIDEGDTTTDWYQAVRTEAQSGKIFAVGHSGKIIQIGG